MNKCRYCIHCDDETERCIAPVPAWLTAVLDSLPCDLDDAVELDIIVNCSCFKDKPPR